MLTFIMRELLKNSFRATLDITPDVSCHSKKIPADTWRISAFPEFSALQCSSSKWDFSCQRTKASYQPSLTIPKPYVFKACVCFYFCPMNPWHRRGRAGKSSNRSHRLRQRSTCDDTRLGGRRGGCRSKIGLKMPLQMDVMTCFLLKIDACLFCMR